MSLDELISIERVEFQTTKERIQETYVLSDLMLSKLFREVLAELKRDFLPILDIKVLLYSLGRVLLTDRVRGARILEDFKTCMEDQLYGKLMEWNCKNMTTKIKELEKLTLDDYSIEGSLKLYHDSQIEWDLGVGIVL